MFKVICNPPDPKPCKSASCGIFPSRSLFPEAG